jgi:signal transduction histidine kinase
MYSSIICPTEYRYRINGGRWSLWSTHNEVEINNLDYGSSRIDVQARDVFGRVSEISSLYWSVATPFYLQWWAFLIYLLIVVAIVYNLMLWRTRRLNAEKLKLESIVAKRTSELEASNSQLSQTLDDLKRTQDNLVRMERTATAGKLTQGLIDRILNPINYLNNFSKLTSGLAKDLMDDIEDEKENISKDNYEDCTDIIEMMKTNLHKIEEHGISTTRTLRAMEAMLNSHIGTMSQHDLIALCRQTVAVTKDYHKTAIAECNIRLVCDMPDKQMLLNIDAESMKNALIAMLNNSIYSVTKKAKATTEGYTPEIVVGLPNEGTGITIRDNGMGIEETIIDKVFDPFFTTKPTGEAAGVGLYLVRNTINDHNGKISVESQKDEYCQFTITL